VGANVGLYACLARARGHFTIAVEPLPSNLKFLYRNLSINELTDVEVFPVGLGARPAVREIFGFSDVASFVQNWNRGAEIHSEMVPISTLDILIGDRFAGQRLFIKMDIEGYEFEALQGAKLILKRTPQPIWMVEILCTNPRTKALNPYYQTIFRTFWANGYRAYIASSGLSEVDEATVESWTKDISKEAPHNFVFCGEELVLDSFR
jgi:FkbM family methyltransferase